VLEHLVHLLVKSFQLVLVLLQLGLLLRDCGLVVGAGQQGRVCELLVLSLQLLVDLADREYLLVIRLDLSVVDDFVDALNHFGAFFVNWLADFLDVATERAGKHVLVEARELLEDLLVQKLLCQGI
jgi:hypothetical protein